MTRSKFKLSFRWWCVIVGVIAAAVFVFWRDAPTAVGVASLFVPFLAFGLLAHSLWEDGLVYWEERRKRRAEAQRDRERLSRQAK